MNVTEILNRASSLRIAVVGDFIYDEYIIGSVTRISPEAPVPVLKIGRTISNPGGAGNVVENLNTLGVHKVSAFYANPKVIKTRVMSSSHHLLRIDDEEMPPRWQKWIDVDFRLKYGIQTNQFDCVVISDYGKGTVSEDVALHLIDLCNDYNIPVVVDTKVLLHKMKKATLVKCNMKEWQNQMIDRYKPDFWMRQMDIHHVVITDGGNGIDCHTMNGPVYIKDHVEGIPVTISDVCGAGDTVTAVLAICIPQIASLKDACVIANIAGSEVCKHPGVYPITKQELIDRYNELYPTVAPVHPIRLQPNAPEAQNSDQTDIKGADGGSDASTSEREGQTTS